MSIPQIDRTAVLKHIEELNASRVQLLEVGDDDAQEVYEDAVNAYLDNLEGFCVLAEAIAKSVMQ